MKVLHVITGLNDGGAESVLCRLCINTVGVTHLVVSLTDKGKYGRILTSEGIQVYCLEMRRGSFSFVAFLRLIKIIRDYEPDVVQTWMYHADFLGGLAAKIAGVKNVIWGIRHSSLERGKSKLSTILLVRVLAILSWWIPNRIVVCANRAISVHAKLCYNTEKMHFIPNGYDTLEVKPMVKQASRLKAALNIHSAIPLIGCVARYDPQKDHDNLFNALDILRQWDIPFRCLLVGTGMQVNNKSLMNKIRYYDLEDNVVLLGPRSDIPVVMSVIDIHVLPSSAEGFPNVVAEAMACETPCVVTDVGDAANIVSTTGWIVPPKNSLELAKALVIALDESAAEGWQQRCVNVRERIKCNFGIDRMISEYTDLWSENGRSRIAS